MTRGALNKTASDQDSGVEWSGRRAVSVHFPNITLLRSGAEGQIREGEAGELGILRLSWAQSRTGIVRMLQLVIGPLTKFSEKGQIKML